MGRNSRLLLTLAILLLPACGSTPPKDVEVYYLEPAQGLIRKQENEVLPFPKAKGYFCANPKDFQTVVSCLQAEAKVYYIDPPQGLVRKQSGEVRPFSASKGFLCVSPDDAETILQDCE